MKVFGSLSELVSIVFRKDGQNQTLRPSQAVTYTAARDYQLPPQDASSTIVSIDATQTLTNKTISGASNTLTGVSLTTGVSGILPPANGGTGVANSTTLTLGANNTTLVTSGTTSVTLPTTGTLATLSGSETFNNKVIANTSTILIKDSNLTIQDDGDTTKTVQLQLSGITTGTLRTLTVPDASITLVGRADTATLSNKTLDSSNVATLTDANFVLLNTSDTSKTVKFNLANVTTATQRTLTIPDANLVVVGTTTAQTLTNKTIDASANTVTNVSLTTAVTGILPISSGGTGATSKVTAYNALSPNTTKGDIEAYDGTNTVRLPVGADGTVLSADSTQTSGLKYVSVLSNPMTTLGDIIVGGSSGAATRLGIGAAGTVLKGGTTPSYAAIVNADVSASAAIVYSKLSLATSIVNADIAVAAAIAGTKISPVFGTQNISATGTLSITGVPTFTANSGQLVSTTNTPSWLVTANSNAASSTSTLGLGYVTATNAGQIQYANDTGTLTIGTNGNAASLTLTDVSNVAALKVRQASTRSQLNLGGLTMLTADVGTGNTYLGTNGQAATSTATSSFYLDSSGHPFFPNATTTGSIGNAFLDGSNQLLKGAASSLRYKSNVQTLTDAESSALYSLRAVSYTSDLLYDKNASMLGLIAEEVAAVEPRLVIFDEQGRPDALQYAKMVVLLISEVQKLRDRIVVLEAAR